MSVINKVLRDLDKRQGASGATSADAGGVRSGTASVTAPEGPGARASAKSASAKTKPRSSAGWTGPLLILLVVLGGGALWKSGPLEGLLSAQPSPAPVQPPAALPVTPVAVEPAVPVVEPIAMEPASRFDLTLTVPPNLRPSAVATPTPVPSAPTASIAAAKVSTPPPEPKLAEPKPLAPAAAPTTASVAPVAPAAPPAAVPTAAEMAQKQLLAGRDALSHAQTLWNGGSRDAAVDLLQQAVATAERAAASTPNAANTQTLVLLVREFGRMQLSEGRPAAVWETLTRLEPVLRDQPEMWALRANAAQRMGRHQDSVHAYMTALQARPTEQRWLLGSAVSLAALGQTVSATEMAEKARAAGPISKEVQTYLRQMGVLLKEP